MIFDLLFTFCVLASGIVANRYLLVGHYLTASFLVALRMTVAGGLILAFGSFRSTRLRWSYIREDLSRILVIAGVATLLPAYLKASALTSIPAAKQTLLGSIDPFVTAAYAYFLWGEPLTWRKLLGMCIGFVGIAIAVVGHAPGEVSLAHWLWLSWPELASFVSVAVSRYGWILVQRIIHTERYLPYEITALSMFMAGSLLLFAVCVRAAIVGEIASLMHVPAANAWTVISVLLYSIFIGNIVGYTTYGYALKRHTSTVVAVTGLSMPLFVAIIEWTVGLGKPQPSFWLATAVLAVGFIVFFSDKLWKRA